MALTLFQIESPAHNVVRGLYNRQYWAERSRACEPDIFAEHTPTDDTPMDASEGDTPPRELPPLPVLRVTTKHLPKDVATGFVFGSDDTCDIQLDDNYLTGVSRRHFAITFNLDTGGLLLRNLSKRGTLLTPSNAEGIHLMLQRVLAARGYYTVHFSGFRIEITAFQDSISPEYQSYLQQIELLVPDFKQLQLRSNFSSSTGINVTPGGYRLGKELGSGTCGVVHQAFDSVTDHVFAVKTIRMPREQGRKGMPQREAQILQSCAHGNIIQFYGFNWTGDFEAVLAMEYAPHGDMYYEHLEKTPLSVPEGIEVITQALRGVEYLHDCKIAHRDLKPGNILLVSRNPIRAKLGDFGLAAIGLSKHNTFLGTERYMAPEVRRPSYTNKVDIWSMGIIVAELWAGLPSYQGREPWLQMLKDHAWLGSRSGPAIDFIKKSVNTDPAARMTAKQCLEHPFLVGGLESSSIPRADSRGALLTVRPGMAPFPEGLLSTAHQSAAAPAPAPRSETSVPRQHSYKQCCFKFLGPEYVSYNVITRVVNMSQLLGLTEKQEDAFVGKNPKDRRHLSREGPATLRGLYAPLSEVDKICRTLSIDSKAAQVSEFRRQFDNGGTATDAETRQYAFLKFRGIEVYFDMEYRMVNATNLGRLAQGCSKDKIGRYFEQSRAKRRTEKGGAYRGSYTTVNDARTFCEHFGIERGVVSDVINLLVCRLKLCQHGLLLVQEGPTRQGSTVVRAEQDNEATAFPSPSSPPRQRPQPLVSGGRGNKSRGGPADPPNPTVSYYTEHNGSHLFPGTQSHLEMVKELHPANPPASRPPHGHPPWWTESERALYGGASKSGSEK